MATGKSQPDNRSSNCLRKYRIFFVFGITILCVQVYLAYTFFALENETRTMKLSLKDVSTRSSLLAACYSNVSLLAKISHPDDE